MPDQHADLPKAKHINSLVYLGRQVYTIEGRKGVYGTGPRINDIHGDSVFCHIVDRPGRGHGTQRTKTLYHLPELSNKLMKAFA